MISNVTSNLLLQMCEESRQANGVHHPLTQFYATSFMEVFCEETGEGKVHFPDGLTYTHTPQNRVIH